jgi:hypothetical protein
MDSSNPSAVRADPLHCDPFPRLLYSDLETAGQGEKLWLWRGFLAPGEVTLLTSQWKSGKSTLVSVLLSKMKTGGMLAGLTVAPGKAVVISEESPTKWFERSRCLTFGDHLSWFCRPFRGKPSMDEWLALLDQVGRLHDQHHLDLLVVDSLANLTPMRSENDAGEMLQTLLPLQRLTSRGMGVLLPHHPHKGAIVPGQAARGSGALSGYVDIIIEMQRISNRHTLDRRRRLRSYSRHDTTPANWVIELNADGTDYLTLGTSAEPQFETGWPILKSILEKAEGPLTRLEILHAWPGPAAPPARKTLWRWLDLALKEEWVLRRGEGTRNHAFTYQLPGMVQKWQEAFIEEFNKKLEQGPIQM